MRTLYISKKRLEHEISTFEEDLENAPPFSHFDYVSAVCVLRDFPNCKYYIYDGFSETFKPSKRK